MNSLKVRFKQATILRDNALRKQEHNTLNRLMYTCRNAHRRAPYFLRLEHVRRLLRRINGHPAWYTICRPGKDSSKIHKKKRDTITPTDVRKIEDLTNLVDTLVNRAVPNAASRYTFELIAREHFIPLATTVVAILARIFALERPLLRNLQGALTEARIIAPPPRPTKPLAKSASKSSGKSSSQNAVFAEEEDVGQVVSSQNATSTHPVQKTTKSRSKRSKRFFSAELDEPEQKTEASAAAATPARKRHSFDEKATPNTLYDAMALENPNLAALAKAQVTTHRAGAENGRASGQKDKTPASGKTEQKKAKNAVEDDLDDIFAALSD